MCRIWVLSYPGKVDPEIALTCCDESAVISKHAYNAVLVIYHKILIKLNFTMRHTKHEMFDIVTHNYRFH